MTKEFLYFRTFSSSSFQGIFQHSSLLKAYIEKIEILFVYLEINNPARYLVNDCLHCWKEFSSTGYNDADRKKSFEVMKHYIFEEILPITSLAFDQENNDQQGICSSTKSSTEEKISSMCCSKDISGNFMKKFENYYKIFYEQPCSDGDFLALLKNLYNGFARLNCRRKKFIDFFFSFDLASKKKMFEEDFFRIGFMKEMFNVFNCQLDDKVVLDDLFASYTQFCIDEECRYIETCFLEGGYILSQNSGDLKTYYPVLSKMRDYAVYGIVI
jgi:hypothetical protein